MTLYLIAAAIGYSLGSAHAAWRSDTVRATHGAAFRGIVAFMCGLAAACGLAASGGL